MAHDKETLAERPAVAKARPEPLEPVIVLEPPKPRRSWHRSRRLRVILALAAYAALVASCDVPLVVPRLVAAPYAIPA